MMITMTLNFCVVIIQAIVATVGVNIIFMMVGNIWLGIAPMRIVVFFVAKFVGMKKERMKIIVKNVWRKVNEENNGLDY